MACIVACDGRWLVRRKRLTVERSTPIWLAKAASERFATVRKSESFMVSNVHRMNIKVNKQCSHADILRTALAAHTVHMGKKPHFLREWRTYRNKTLVQVADVLHMTHGNLSKIERGLVPYNQELLERLAALYMCEPADLIIRDPSEPIDIWSVWDRAKSGDKAKIVSIARTIVDDSAAA